MRLTAPGTARVRVAAIVAAVALVAVAATVGVVLASRGSESAGDETSRPRTGVPPLLLDLGVRTDSEADALRRAQRLYTRGRRSEAGRIFRRYGSLEGEIGAAFAAWPSGSAARLEEIAREHPNRSAAQLHLGLARFWLGRSRGALDAWRRAERVELDSVSAVRAGDLLHPEFATGLPTFVPGFPLPPELERLEPPAQLAFLKRRARARAARPKLLYGLALQRLGRPLSARRQYEAAAALAPRDAEAQVAAAVGQFDKRRPERAFGRLGPLTRTFPRAPTVRLHLGLLLLWTGRVDEARRQLARAAQLEPRSPLGREAKRILATVGQKPKSGS